MTNKFMEEDTNDIYTDENDYDSMEFDDYDDVDVIPPDDEDDDLFGLTPQQRLDYFEAENEGISFERDSERNAYCKKYEKLMRDAGIDEDTIEDRITDIQNGTMTREDLCDYYGGIDDDELDDAMDDDMRDYD